MLCWWGVAHEAGMEAWSGQLTQTTQRDISHHRRPCSVCKIEWVGWYVPIHAWGQTRYWSVSGEQLYWASLVFSQILSLPLLHYNSELKGTFYSCYYYHYHYYIFCSFSHYTVLISTHMVYFFCFWLSSSVGDRGEDEHLHGMTGVNPWHLHDSSSLRTREYPGSGMLPPGISKLHVGPNKAKEKSHLSQIHFFQAVCSFLCANVCWQPVSLSHFQHPRQGCCTARSNSLLRA